MVITPIAASLLMALALSTAFWLIWRRQPRSWGSVTLGFLMLLVGFASIATGRVGRLWFPEMTAVGTQAKVYGVACVIFGAVWLYAGFRPKSDSNDPTI